MLRVVAAEVWHYWLSWFIVVPFALVILALAVMYVVKVVAAKYPRQ